MLKFGRKGSVMGIQGLPKFLVPHIISGTSKATNFKFGRYIYRGHPNKKKHLKVSEKGSVGVSMDCQNFFEYPLLSQEWVKLQTSNFVRTFTASIGTKAH